MPSPAKKLYAEGTVVWQRAQSLMDDEGRPEVLSRTVRFDNGLWSYLEREFTKDVPEGARVRILLEVID